MYTIWSSVWESTSFVGTTYTKWNGNRIKESGLMMQDEALKQLKYHLDRTQEQMAKFANWRRRPLQIEVGDQVFLKIRPHRQIYYIKVTPKVVSKILWPFSSIR